MSVQAAVFGPLVELLLVVHQGGEAVVATVEVDGLLVGGVAFRGRYGPGSATVR